MKQTYGQKDIKRLFSFLCKKHTMVRRLRRGTRRRTTKRVRKRRRGQMDGVRNHNRIMFKMGMAFLKGLGMKEKAS